MTATPRTPKARPTGAPDGGGDADSGQGDPQAVGIEVLIVRARNGVDLVE